MANSAPQTVLCICSYEKGQDFMRECKRLGCTVLLVTVSSLEDARWPRESIDEIFFMPDGAPTENWILAVGYLARTRQIDRVVALDDYDVEPAAAIREHLRVPGMGATTARNFRDKLAMRGRAHDRGVPVPDFVPILNYDRIREWMSNVSPPWVLKPRSEASSIGIVRIESRDEFWPRLEQLGDRQSFFLLERFVPGDVFHVDSLVADREVVFAEVHQYGRPPMEVYHGGGVSMSRTIRRGAEDEQALQVLNRQVIGALGMVRGVTHIEYIKGQDGRHYFLEAAARVGGAHTADLVEAATGINLWREWARIEVEGDGYRPPAYRDDYAGIILSLAQQQEPDTSTYAEPEIVWRLSMPQHVGLIVVSHDPDRVEELLQQYAQRFAQDFLATLPPRTARPPSR